MNNEQLMSADKVGEFYCIITYSCKFRYFNKYFFLIIFILAKTIHKCQANFQTFFNFFENFFKLAFFSASTLHGGSPKRFYNKSCRRT